MTRRASFVAAVGLLPMALLLAPETMAFKAAKTDSIIAIGGGASMDTVKAVGIPSGLKGVLKKVDVAVSREERLRRRLPSGRDSESEGSKLFGWKF